MRSLIEIAHSRGWTEVTVSGTERFREGAWRQARLEGLAVRGYRPTDGAAGAADPCARAARIVRDETIKPREAMRKHPELAGTYLSLRAAEPAARGLRDSQDQRRFVAQVRSAIADDIERGASLQPVRLPETPSRTTDRLARYADRSLVP